MESEVTEGSGDCAEGKHELPLQPDLPDISETTVNVKWRCPRCKVVVLEDSYTRAEWERRKGS